MDTDKFHRVGQANSAAVGRAFEEAAQSFFQSEGVELARNFVVPVGYRLRKDKRFDLGSANPRILVECKSYTWTVSGNSPSGKIRGMNEAMLLFSVAPRNYRKILFVLKNLHPRSKVSLVSHYIRNHGHLIDPSVEVWEFDVDTKQGARVF